MKFGAHKIQNKNVKVRFFNFNSKCSSILGGIIFVCFYFRIFTATSLHLEWYLYQINLLRLPVHVFLGDVYHYGYFNLKLYDRAVRGNIRPQKVVKNPSHVKYVSTKNFYIRTKSSLHALNADMCPLL